MKSINELLIYGVKILDDANITSARLDARLLLEHALGISHEQLLLRKNQSITLSEEEVYLNLIQQRANNKPISYIIGKREFFSKDFFVNEHSLIPRPDTEIIVEACLKLFPKDQKIKILDIGTGSGCIAICLADYYSHSEVSAIDISVDALEIAKKNSQYHNVKINFMRNHNFASGIGKKFDLIVSNPPYIPSDDIKALQNDVKDYEPLSALDGGEDGLDPYRIIISQSRNILNKNGKLVFEIGINQAQDIISIAEKNDFRLLEKHKDLALIERCLIFEQK